MSYSARIALRTEVDGLVLSRSEQILSGRKAIGPAKVHLRAGERSRVVEIAKPLPANASPAESYFIIVSDRPGVRARVSVTGTPDTVLANGNLLTGTEDVLSQVQDGSTYPCYTQGGSWINNAAGSASGYRAAKWAASSTAGDVGYAGDAWVSSMSGITVGGGLYVFGRSNPVNLGVANDGKIFQIWAYTPTTTNLTSVKMLFGSFPFGTDADDDEPTANEGTVNDETMVGDTPPGYYYTATVTSQCGSNRWNLITVKKSDFTTAGTGTPAPYWGTITSFRLQWTYSSSPGAVNVGGSALYFGDPADSEVNGVRIIPAVLTDRSGICVSLDAPDGSDANVTVMAVVS